MATRPTLQRVRAKPADSGNVIEELRRRYDLLTHSQKRIAEYIVDHSQGVAFSTVDQMAAQLGVNPSTIVRFCYRLGLNGFPDLQERMRQVVRGQLSRADEQVEAGTGGSHLQGTSFGASLAHDLRNLQRTIMGLSADDLNSAVDQVVAARRVYVVAGYSAFSVAHYFGLVLSRLRPDTFTIMADEGVSKVRIAEITAPDCLVAFTFPRYAARSPTPCWWRRRPEPACRIPWWRPWRLRMRSSTASPPPTARSRWSATAAATVCSTNGTRSCSSSTRRTEAGLVSRVVRRRRPACMVGFPRRRITMTDTAAAKAIGMGIAGGAIATALIDLLIAKGLIDHEEARGVLENAMYRAAMYTGTFEGLEATKIIGDLLETGLAGDGLAQSRP
jgi:DNA-binding MurR/RpiR family transcriptional regulator